MRERVALALLGLWMMLALGLYLSQFIGLLATLMRM